MKQNYTTKFVVDALGGLDVDKRNLEHKIAVNNVDRYDALVGDLVNLLIKAGSKQNSVYYGEKVVAERSNEVLKKMHQKIGEHLLTTTTR